MSNLRFTKNDSSSENLDQNAQNDWSEDNLEVPDLMQKYDNSNQMKRERK